MEFGRRDFRLVASFAAVIVAFVMLVPVGGIFGLVDEAESAPSESVLRIGFLQNVDSLNPYIGIADTSYLFYSLIYDSLQGIGEDLEPIPALALSWWALPASMTGEPDGSVWQYNLSRNTYWSDGVPFTADDVVWNINLNAQNFASMWAYQPYSYYMEYAEAVDPFTVRIYFSDRATSDPMPVSFGGQLFIPMLPMHLLSSMNAYEIGLNWTGIPAVGTGPFVPSSSLYSDWLAGNPLTLLRNPNSHWLTDFGKVVHFDKLQMWYFVETTSMQYALESNDIDIIAGTSMQSYRALEEGIRTGAIQNLNAFDAPSPMNYWTEIGFCMNNAGLNPSRLDLTIRQAIAMSVNKTYIVQQYYLGLAEEGSTLISPMFPSWHREPTLAEKFQYDLASANAMLESAGYIDMNADGIREATASSWAYQQGLVAENKPLAYELLVRREHPEEKDIAQYMQDRLRQVGIQINYVIVDEMMLATIVHGYSYDMFIWCWSSDPDPNYILFTQSRMAWGGWSDTMYSSATYDYNYTMSVESLDQATRETNVDDCQIVHYLDCPYIILAYVNDTFAWRTDTFAGWGDWASNPGRRMSAFWCGNQLYFDLVPIVGSDAPPVNVQLYALPLPTVVDQDVYFFAFAADVFGDPLSFWLDFGDGAWAHESSPGGSNDPQLAEFSHRYMAVGNFTATLWVDDDSGLEWHNVSVQLTVVVESGMPRTVDYLWYDMFNVSFHEWDYTRWIVYAIDQPLTDTYPYLYKNHGLPPGQDVIYSKMRLNVTGRDMRELNMASNPEFLPFLGSERGGTAKIDWYMQYLTEAELLTYYRNVSGLNDGWVTSLNGTVTMDEQAAKGVLNLSDAGFDDFGTWWAANQISVTENYTDWLSYEAGPYRLDIYPMFDATFMPIWSALDAERIGDEIVLSYDFLSWGMEALMTRWLREAFMPTEWYFEDFGMHAVIGPELTDINIDTAVQYAVYAFMSPETGKPCWAWEAMLQDHLPSDPIAMHPRSDFDPYFSLMYLDRYPGSGTYGQWVPYDYTPGTFDLWYGETLTFQWPAGDQLYLDHSGTGDWGTTNQTARMIAALAEPNATDMPEQVYVSPTDRTITFEGMAPFYAWSLLQDTHPYLLSEWQRLWELPYGCPYIEFRNGTYTQPVASFTVGPADGNEYTTFEFNASTSSDVETGSNDLIVRWDWENDGEWDTEWLADKVADHKYGIIGTYTAKLEVCDGDGMLDTTTRQVTVNDGTSPLTVISLSGKQGINGWYTSKVNMTLSATDANSGVASTKYWIDGGQPQDYTAPVAVVLEGTFVIGFCSIDNAGNQESNKTTSVKVDSVAPQIEVTSPSKFKPGDVTITWTCNDTASGLGLVETGLEGAPLVKRSNLTSVTLANMTAGEYTMRIRATDNAGNVAEITISFMVEDKGISSTVIYAAAGIGIAAVAAVVALLLLRRGKGGQEQAKP